ncbi:MAG: CBS domain-containing protein [Bacilli bacterium]|jgi:CBS domain-containing protein
MQNILFFLIPKKNIEYIYDTYTIRQALEKMEYYHYTMIPIISREGKYVSSISDADLLWYIKENDLNLEKSEKMNIMEIKPFREIKSMTIDKEVTDLIELMINQNFIPVVDDVNNFIGIVTRKAVLEYLSKNIKE